MVVEDEYFLADDLTRAVSEAGGTVVGPFAAYGAAEALAREDGALDACILDINLRGEMAFPLAEALHVRGVSLVIATGYEAEVLPPSLRHLPQARKPLPAAEIVDLLARTLAEREGNDGGGMDRPPVPAGPRGAGPIA